MADVFQEVDEMMKQERLEKFWKENGLWIIALIILSIAGTAAFSAYKSWNKNVKEQQTAELIALLDAPDFPAGIDETVAEFRAPLRGIALLSAAQKYQTDENAEQALETYKKVAIDDSIPEEFRHMGQIMAVRLDNTLSADQKLEQLQAIQNNESSPWQYHAYMEGALIQAHEKNDYAAARTLLEPLKERENVPSSMKEKANKLDHVYAVMVNKNTNDTDGDGS